MRVIDQPSPDTVVMGGMQGGLFVQAAEVWHRLYAPEYETPDIRVELTRKARVRRIRLPAVPLLSPPEPVTFADLAPLAEWTVELQTYRVGDAMRWYGFDAQDCRFFVGEGSE